MSAPVPTQEELADFSLACQKIWDLDQNRLEPNREYQINLQVCALAPQLLHSLIALYDCSLYHPGVTVLMSPSMETL